MELLSILEDEGRGVFPREGKLIIRPMDGLQEGDRRVLADLKPELMVLTTFTAPQRAGIARIWPEADLDDLLACRAALDAWEAFTAQERGAMDPRRTVRDIARIGRLKEACRGEVVPIEDTTNST